MNKAFQNNTVNIKVASTIFSQDFFDLIKKTIIRTNGKIIMKDSELKEHISYSYEFYMWNYSRTELQSDLLYKTNLKLYGKYYYKYNKYMNSQMNYVPDEIGGLGISPVKMPQLKSDKVLVMEMSKEILKNVYRSEDKYAKYLSYYSKEDEMMDQSSKRKYNGNAQFWMGEIGNGALFKSPRSGSYNKSNIDTKKNYQTDFD
jgi:hypothetical protein